MTSRGMRALAVVPLAVVLAACASESADCGRGTAALASCIYIAQVDGVTFVDQPLARPVPRRMLGKKVEGVLPPCTSPVIDYDCDGAPPSPTPQPHTFRRIKGIPAGWALVHERHLGRRSILVPADEQMEPDYTEAPESLRRLVERGMPRNVDSPFE